MVENRGEGEWDECFSRAHKLLSPQLRKKSRQKMFIRNAFTILPFETHLTKYVIVFFKKNNKCNMSNIVNPTKPFFLASHYSFWPNKVNSFLLFTLPHFLPLY